MKRHFLWAVRVLAASGLICWLAVQFPNAAIAQTHDETFSRCRDRRLNPDLRIEACNALIRAGSETTENLAVAFNNRGVVYEYKRDFDHAIQDYGTAIRLNPGYWLALNNR